MCMLTLGVCFLVWMSCISISISSRMFDIHLYNNNSWLWWDCWIMLSMNSGNKDLLSADTWLAWRIQIQLGPLKIYMSRLASKNKKKPWKNNNQRILKTSIILSCWHRNGLFRLIDLPSHKPFRLCAWLGQSNKSHICPKTEQNKVRSS